MDTIKCRAKEEQKDKEQDLKYKGIQASVGRFFLGFVNFFLGKKLKFGAKVKTAQEVMPKSR